MQTHWRLRTAGFTVAALLGVAISAAAWTASSRWYTVDQVQRGGAIYAQHCAACHGQRGQGQPGWQQRDEMGYYPAPPLNADGHAWHHPLAEMLKTLDTGGGPNGGTMPSFVDVLDDAGKKAVLAFVQSLWSDEMYGNWAAIDRGEAQPPPLAQRDD